MKVDTQKSLDDLLAQLPRDLAPPRNLWRGISRRMDQNPRRVRPLVYAAAASVIGACVASAITWAVLHGQPAAPAAQLAAHPPAFDEPRNPSYVAARDDLELNFRERLSRLDPATRGAESRPVWQSFAARTKISARRSPAILQAQLLEQLWQSTWHDELDLYDHVVHGPRNLR